MDTTTDAIGHLSPVEHEQAHYRDHQRFVVYYARDGPVDSGVEFRLLGSLEVCLHGRVVVIPAGRRRALLAMLLLRANQVVSVEELLERLWGQKPMASSLNALQTVVRRLRENLATGDGDREFIRTGSRGYLIDVASEEVDLCCFTSLLEQAGHTERAGDVGGAAALLRDALGLWRGPALVDVHCEVLHRDVVPALTEQRLHAWEHRIDLELRLGQHHRLIPELQALSSQHPLREQLCAHLMLALYRDHRQAEALQAYRRLSTILAEEFGLDPSGPLQQLHQRILTADPALALPTSKPTPESARSLVPRQLPAPSQRFTGRIRELAQLTGALDTGAEWGGTVVISAIGGTGGIGKTALALHWAHQNVERFPDGQLYVNLRGFDPSGSPVPPAVAVRGFLGALGIDSGAIPVDVDAQVGLYRSLVAGKRMLVVLDNARDTTYVTPLLPGSPSCTVLVTSRHRLGGLVTAHGARPLALDVLTETEAHQLLTRHLGHDRIAAEPEAVAALLQRCAGLPLAISIVAARAATHPNFPLAALAEELREASARLDTLDAGELTANLRAVFSWSYHALDAEVAGMFGLLGLVPGPDIGLPATTSLTAQPTARVRALLRELEGAHLVQQHTPGRYRMHDLVRLYAAERAYHDESQDARDAALRRLIDFYLHTAYTGERLLNPHRSPIELDPPAPGCLPQPLEEETSVLAWFDTEHSCLLAAQRLAVQQGWYTSVWQLAWTLNTIHYRRGYLHDYVAAWRAGLAAADQLDEPATRVLAHRGLGGACVRAGEHAEALDHLRQALALAEQAGDVPDQAHTHRVLAWAWGQQGDDQRALAHASRALRLFQILDNPVGEAMALNAVGWYQARLGHHQQARACCEQALALFRQHRYREGEAATLDSLGYLAHHSGQHTEALDYYHQALTLRRDLDNTYQEANTLAYLGQVHAALSQHTHARAAWQQALDLYHAQHCTAEAQRIQDQLAALGDDEE